MSEAKKRRIYTKEFKQDALNLSEQPGYTAVLAAKTSAFPRDYYINGEARLRNPVL